MREATEKEVPCSFGKAVCQSFFVPLSHLTEQEHT